MIVLGTPPEAAGTASSPAEPLPGTGPSGVAATDSLTNSRSVVPVADVSARSCSAVVPNDLLSSGTLVGASCSVSSTAAGSLSSPASFDRLPSSPRSASSLLIVPDSCSTVPVTGESSRSSASLIVVGATPARVSRPTSSPTVAPGFASSALSSTSAEPSASDGCTLATTCSGVSFTSAASWLIVRSDRSGPELLLEPTTCSVASAPGRDCALAGMTCRPAPATATTATVRRRFSVRRAGCRLRRVARQGGRLRRGRWT